MAKLEVEERKTQAKLELINISSELMPQGQPLFQDMVKYPMIRELVAGQPGKSIVMKALFLMVKDFCSSMNVVRNMNEDQMIECAAMLLDECDNFRMEDYLMMFQMAKRGRLARIMDRVDMQLISQVMDEYWSMRREAGRKIQEEGTQHLESLGPALRTIDHMNHQDAKLQQSVNGLMGAVENMRARMTDWQKGETKPE